MKNKIFNSFISILISISMIFGVNNFCYATGGDDQNGAGSPTAVIHINAANTGLKADNKVTFTISVSAKDTSFNFGSLDITIRTDENLTYTSIANEQDKNLRVSGDKNDPYMNFTMAYDDNTPTITNTGKLKLADITYVLSHNCEENENVQLYVLPCTLIGDNAELGYEFDTETNVATVTNDNTAKESETTLTYTLTGGTNGNDNQDGKPSETPINPPTNCNHDNKFKVLKKEATCTEEGALQNYYYCPQCKKYFSDKNCTTELDEVYCVVTAKGHDWDAGVETTKPTYLADGVKTFTCSECKETKTEVIPKLTHDDKTAGVQYWGERQVIAGHEMYVDANGKTSALINGNDYIWLKEKSYDPAAGKELEAWYMLDNTSGEFEAGSRFSVQWLNNKDNPIEFLTHFNNIDQTIKDRIDSNRVWIFLVTVTKPDGTTEYKTLSKEIPFYIQMGSDWDYSDVKAMYISESEDEQVYAAYLNMAHPEGKGEFAKLSLKHFSPYAIYDYLNDEEKAEFDKLTDEQKAQFDQKMAELIANQEKQVKSEKSSSSGVKTGDNISYIVLISLSALIISGLYLEICIKKKRN